MKPYGYVRKDGEGIFLYGEHQFQNPQAHDLVPVYTKLEWVGLTEGERVDILDAELTVQSTEHFALAQAIEAALKKKNT